MSDWTRREHFIPFAQYACLIASAQSLEFMTTFPIVLKVTSPAFPRWLCDARRGPSASVKTK